ncbi:MAG: hypothetical protein R2755_07820 [Acidimicrobiales bacterium]
MPAVEHHDEFVVDPDEVKVPESLQHRAAVGPHRPRRPTPSRWVRP